MRRVPSVVILVFFLMFPLVGTAAAQDVDMAFSDEKLGELGLPVVQVTVGPDGIEAPSSLESGVYLIELMPTDEYSVYMNIVIPPDDLSEEELREQVLLAARDDMVLPGWTFLGGTNTFGIGASTRFAIELQPGEYHIAGSYYLPDGDEEIMNLVPLTVTAEATPVAGATPQATPVISGVPQADVVLEMTDDLEFVVTPDPVPAGPQLWELTNTGTDHHHHMVMYGVPEGTTADDIVAGFEPLFAGEEPSDDSIVMEMMPAGYAAIQSGGMTTWNEFDLEPGTYAVLCFISDTGDPDEWHPHLLDGMVTIFEVE